MLRTSFHPTSARDVGAFTLPLHISGMTANVATPELYALDAVTTVFSFLVIGGTLGPIVYVGRRRARI